jgi:hypothetical protein
VANRGRIETVELKRPITFNGKLFTSAEIEIDHINYGLDPNTAQLKTRKRSQFTVKDVLEFLRLLDGEALMRTRRERGRDIFVVQLLSPLTGKTLGGTYRMVFSTSQAEKELIGAITLFKIRE